MSRFSQMDSDEDRLPHGMIRIGYDADTQVYTYKDADGSIWEGAPGHQYGQLTRVSGASGVPAYEDESELDTESLLQPKNTLQIPSWRRDMMPLLNFGVIIGVFFLVLLWYMHHAAAGDEISPTTCPDTTATYKIQKGDTCWAICENHKLLLEDLMKQNIGLVCENLKVGSVLCLPGQT